MDRHHAHGLHPAARERRRRDPRHLEPQVELLGRAGGAKPHAVRQVPYVAHGGKHVRLAGNAGSPFRLQSRQPARLAYDLHADVRDGHAPRRKPRAGEDVVRVRKTTRRCRAMEELHGLDAAVDLAHRRGVERTLGAGAQLQQVAGVEHEHLAREQREEAGLRVLGVRKHVQELCHGGHLRRLRERGTPRHHALEPTLADCVDVERGLRGGTQKERHVARTLAVRRVLRKPVCQRRGSDLRLLGANPSLRAHATGDLHVDAREVARAILVVALRIRIQVHEVGKHAGVAAARAVDQGQHVRVAAVVHGKPHVLLRGELFSPAAKHPHVSASEAIDGLLCVAHRCQVAGIAPCQKANEFQLRRVRVLKLVHHHEPKASRVVAGDGLVVTNGPQRQAHELVVREHARLTLQLRHALVHLARKTDYVLDPRTGTGEKDAGPCLGEGCLRKLPLLLRLLAEASWKRHGGERGCGRGRRATARRKLHERPQYLQGGRDLLGRLCRQLLRSEGLHLLRQTRHDLGHIVCLQKRQALVPVWHRTRRGAHVLHHAHQATVATLQP